MRGCDSPVVGPTVYGLRRLAGLRVVWGVHGFRDEVFGAALV